MNSIQINDFKIETGSRPFIIAEIGQAHDGSLGMAHAYVDAVASAGADAIKFQTHLAKSESTLNEQFRVKFSKQDSSRYDYWKRMEFTIEQWKGLKEHANSKGLTFLSSAFSVDAVELLSVLGMPAWKIGSGEFWSNDLILSMMSHGGPLLVSTGMSTWSEIDDMAKMMVESEYPFALFQCTTKYPTAYSEIGINILEKMIDRYSCPIGFSDHSGSVFPSILAMAKGAAIIEVHVTFHKQMFGPDVPASLSLDELSLVVNARNAFEEINNHRIDKDSKALELMKSRALFSKSVALKKDLKKGHLLREEDLCMKKPGTGIKKEEINKVLGRALANDVPLDRLLEWDDLV